MALDVLSCLDTTVDVERSFNFGRDYVSARRHRLSSLSLTRGMKVAFYSKSGKIESGGAPLTPAGTRHLHPDTRRLHPDTRSAGAGAGAAVSKMTQFMGGYPGAVCHP
ncbi:hypothetical protein PCANC_15921 [Puccinia coronata f. sp. avenae]|uniref:HAT C-terminal dimerisation domain-containing protein n=1 Tax=Puccinia coronata f. sp. avenae TaxID=200324 RepID=A0A2N5UMB8_9BASI|nr:hypothetical protein PCANC_15921 [Puccinia coronata f. sp. avenae]